MSNATSYSKLGYLMLKKETTAGTAVYPNQPVEILSESVVMNWDYTPANTIAGNRSMNLRPIKNRVGPAAGTIDVLVEPNTFGHFLNGLLGEDVVTTLAAGVSVQHDFEPLTTLPTYTMDVKVAGESYVVRYFGVRIQKITWSIEDNKLRASIDIMAQRAFTNARVTTAAGSGTSLDLDQTSGLTTSDTLQILDEADLDTNNQSLTIAAINSETNLTTATITASLAVDDVAVITAQTIYPETYDMSNELIFSGGAEVYIATGSHPMQNLAAKTNCEGMEITVENTLEARWSATGRDVVDRMPFTILLKGVAVTGKFNQFHVNPDFLDKLRSTEQVGMRFQFLGNTLQANSAVAATGTIESSGAGTVTVTVDSAGEAGNDYAILIVQGTTTLSASLSGKLITVTLDADAGDNTVALVASAIDALSGVSATSASTGNVTTTDNPDKIEFTGGRDANERELLRFDMSDVRLQPFAPNLTEDGIIEEEISFTAYRSQYDDREIKVRLRNDIAGY